MRAVFIVLAIALVAAAGFFIYRSSPTTPDEPGLTPVPQAARLPTAEDCLAENAMYEFNDDRRIQLRFRRLPSAGSGPIEMSEAGGQRFGNVSFVVHVTTLGTDYTYTPVNALRESGPAHRSALTRVQPEGGGAPFAVYLFDSQMHYLDQLPRNDTPAPGYVFMPDILPRLYRDRVDQAPGVFRFQTCETPPAPASAP
ncbi:MAG TPA: hypothetical protein VEF55_07850 [Candidatus Binatia bacterium]|nr:hypothetical protein [Candidatus Binatia bacterium]